MEISLSKSFCIFLLIGLLGGVAEAGTSWVPPETQDIRYLGTSWDYSGLHFISDEEMVLVNLSDEQTVLQVTGHVSITSSTDEEFRELGFQFSGIENVMINAASYYGGGVAAFPEGTDSLNLFVDPVGIINIYFLTLDISAVAEKSIEAKTKWMSSSSATYYLFSFNPSYSLCRSIADGHRTCRQGGSKVCYNRGETPEQTGLSYNECKPLET